jgi:hypothetical protein
MSCTLTQGSTIGCLKSVGGIKKLYIGDFNDLASYTATAGVITAVALTAEKQMWTYNVEKQNCAFAQEVKKSLEAGTIYYETKVDWTMKKMTAAMNQELSALLSARLFVAFKDNNGINWITGLENCMDAMTAPTGTGKMFSDLNGYTIGLTGQEPEMAYQISDELLATIIVPFED